MKELPLAPMPGRGLETARLEQAPPPEPEETEALARLWAETAPEPEQRRGRRDLLLPALIALQEARGWISYPALAAVCLELTVPLADAYGVATFYGLLSTEPGPRTTIYVCDDIACRLRGAEALAHHLEQTLGPPRGSRTVDGSEGRRLAQSGADGRADGAVVPDGAGGADRTGRAVAPDGNGSSTEAAPSGLQPPAVGWTFSPCLGQCDRAPAVMFHRENVALATPETLDELIRTATADPLTAQTTAPTTVTATAPATASAAATAPAVHSDTDPPPAPETTPAPNHIGHLGDSTPLLLARCGDEAATRLPGYIARGGYDGLRRALDMGPDRVLDEVKRSRLVGRGGAAFPAAIKWSGAAAHPGPRWIVCNADESEPGTFKDRILLERDPFAVIEGMTIAAFTVGAEHGVIYLRGEYSEARRALEHALQQAREESFLGRRILDTDFSFDIELRLGAGAYVCGEETALFNSIEGLRGEPRAKPPFPTEIGLFGRPTVINNVETLACVPPIVLLGGDRFAAIGTPDSTGTKLVSISGHVARPGVYEVPFGTPIRTIIDELAGGVPGNRPVQAVLCGGAAGTFLTPEQLDTPLSFESLRAVEGTVGSGALVVYDDTADLWDAAERIARFFMDESCGQCVPCRVGTRRQWEWIRAERRARAASNGGPSGPDASSADGADVGSDAGPTGGNGASDARLLDLAAVMQDSSICGLGQLAPNALLSLLPLLQEPEQSDGKDGGRR